MVRIGHASATDVACIAAAAAWVSKPPGVGTSRSWSSAVPSGAKPENDA